MLQRLKSEPECIMVGLMIFLILGLLSFLFLAR